MGNTQSKREDEYIIKLKDKYKLGSGAYGTVYKIIRKDNKRPYAAKIYNVPYEIMTPQQKLGYERELKILQETSHPFVINYIEEFVYN